MKQKKKIDWINIVNISTILYILYFIIKYIDLVSKNLIQKANINLYVYILLINIFYFIRKRIK